METLVAREGRHRQRYQDNRRLVSGCIPYRLRKGCEDHASTIENNLEVLMISSPNRHDLVFPKGGWENDETVYEAACREALEEAGVRGILNKTRLGVWEFKSKSMQQRCSLEGGCRGYMFALQVIEELDSWPEQENHGRIWLSIREAFKLCRYDWMREALLSFLKQMERERKENIKLINKDTRNSSTDGALTILPDCQASKPTSKNGVQFTMLLCVHQQTSL